MTTRINDIFGSSMRDLIDRSGGKLAGGTCSASGPFSKDTVGEAWSVLGAPGHADADVIDACRTLIEHCQEGRRSHAGDTERSTPMKREIHSGQPQAPRDEHRGLRKPVPLPRGWWLVPLLGRSACLQIAIAFGRFW